MQYIRLFCLNRIIIATRAAQKFRNFLMVGICKKDFSDYRVYGMIQFFFLPLSNTQTIIIIRTIFLCVHIFSI